MQVDLGERRLRQILAERASQTGLDKAAINAIVDSAQLAHYDPGDTITKAGTTSSLTVIVMSGAVRMMFRGERDEPIILRFVRAGDSLISIDETGMPPAFSSVAHTHCGVAFVSHEILANAVTRMEETNRHQFHLHGWVQLSGLVRDRCELLTRNVRQRLIHGLSMLARDFGSTHQLGTMIDLPVKQDELAQLVVVDRSTLNRALRELETEGLVQRSEGRYVVSPSTLQAGALS